MARNIIPGFRYADAPAAIDFLCEAFGFTRHAVYADDGDPSLIHHAQLTLDGGMIMLGSHRDGEVQRRYGWKTPAEAGGNTASIYVYVADPDAHCEHARTAGAEIVDAPRDNDGYPGRGYSARDGEGHVWSFGSYDPWAD
ncbi:MAG: VOC family protein [Sphingomonadaceae bacterium]|nr:VOC family protein [Sphingomonadaceae bacterium]